VATAAGGSANALGETVMGTAGPCVFFVFSVQFLEVGAQPKNASFSETIAQRQLPLPASENGF
jgi:hypothetical protein